MRAMGNRWTQSGIREDNPTGDTLGRASDLKREERRGELIFQNKTGSDKTRHGDRTKTQLDLTRCDRCIIILEVVIRRW